MAEAIRDREQLRPEPVVRSSLLLLLPVPHPPRPLDMSSFPTLGVKERRFQLRDARISIDILLPERRIEGIAVIRRIFWHQRSTTHVRVADIIYVIVIIIISNFPIVLVRFRLLEATILLAIIRCSEPRSFPCYSSDVLLELDVITHQPRDPLDTSGLSGISNDLPVECR